METILTSVIVAVITGGCSVIAQTAISRSQTQIHVQLTNKRLEDLEKKVDKHNNFMERVAMLEVTKDQFDRSIQEIKDKCRAYD